MRKRWSIGGRARHPDPYEHLWDGCYTNAITGEVVFSGPPEGGIIKTQREVELEAMNKADPQSEPLNKLYIQSEPLRKRRIGCGMRSI